MSDVEESREANWKSAHGAILLVAFAGVYLVPEGLRRWPIPLALPLFVYAIVVVATPALRGTCDWLRIGDFNLRVVIATILLIFVSCGALVLYQVYRQPNLEYLYARFPMRAFGSALVAGAVFILLNPVLEEVVFRGVLLRALEAGWGWWFAVGATSFFFGVGHVGGYPPGAIGGVLAGVYGVAICLLCRYSGGLLAAVIAHLFADATIFGILITAQQA